MPSQAQSPPGASAAAAAAAPAAAADPIGSLECPAASSSLTAWATDADLPTAPWVTLHEESTSLSADAFWQVIHSLTVSQHWNRGIYAVTALAHEVVRKEEDGRFSVVASGSGAGPGGLTAAQRQQQLEEEDGHAAGDGAETAPQPSPLWRYHAKRMLARKSPSPIGGEADDGRAFDATEWTTQWVAGRRHVAAFGLALPTSVVTEDNPRAMRYWPFQYPKTRAYRFVYEERAGVAPDGAGTEETGARRACGTVKYEVVPLGEEASSPRHFETLLRHAKPAALKLVTWLRKRMLHIDPDTLQSTYVKRVHHDSLVEEPHFRAWYDRLKLRYGYWARDWPECTDPVKFVHEEMAIAAYLCALWETERAELGTTRLQSFVDCGCGNGFLVYLLMSEGHPGMGYDLRARGIWDIYPDHVTDALKVEAVEPKSFDVSQFDWVIGNHSDELSPWLPLIAARAQADLESRPLVELPATAAAAPPPSNKASRARRRRRRTASGELEAVSSSDSDSDDGEDESSTVMRAETVRRAAPRVFVLPCCFFDFDGRKVSFGRTRRTLGVRACGKTGKYEQYWRWIGDILRATGFVVEIENLRIPSTKYVALLGRFVRHPERTAPDVLSELSRLVLHDAEMSRM